MLAIFSIIINMFASVSPTNNILHLCSASYGQADTVLDALYVPSIIIPISKMKKPSLKETSTQVCLGSLSPQFDLSLGALLTAQMRTQW